MKRTIIVIVDIIIWLLLVLTIPFFILNTFNGIQTSVVSSASNELIVVFQIILSILSFTVLLVVKYFINKNEVITLSEIIKYQFKNKKLRSILITSLLSIILLVSVLLINQRKLYYIPNHSSYSYNKLSKDDDFLKVELKDNENTYVGWLKNTYEDRPIIIYFGGNGDSSAKFFNNSLITENPIFIEYNFIMLDYPTYGLSKGTLNEENNFKMAILTYEYVVEELGYTSDNIHVIGYSLGSGIATYLASKKAIKNLVLIAPYSSFIDVGNTMFPIFYGPFKHLIKDKYESVNYASDVESNVLIVASKKDEVIKFRLSKKLSNSFSNVKFSEFQDLRHNDFYDNYMVQFVIGVFLISDE